MQDLRRLRYFVAVARERNFTRAAARLHVAQPALSRQVRLLEQELGVELLHRTTHDVTLTQAGEFLLERGEALLIRSDELERGVRGFGTGERGAVIVAYGASASFETAPRLVQALAEEHPGVVMTTTVAASEEIAAGVRDGAFDLGLVRCPTDLSGLDARTIRFERQGVIARRDHRVAGLPAVGLADLADATLVMHPRAANPGHYDALVALCRDGGVEPRLREREVSLDLSYTSITAGDALAIAGESAGIGLPAELVWLPLVPPAVLPVALFTRLHQRSPVAVRLLEDATRIAAELGWADPPGSAMPI